MSVIRCPQGHYYDNQRFSRCPHCGIFGGQAGIEKESENKSGGEKRKGLFGWLDKEKTVAFSQEKAEAFEKAARKRKAADNEEKTVAFSAEGNAGSMEDGSTVALEAISNLPEDEQRTVGFYSGAKGNDYVTGWLVCIEGPEKGRDYRLHHGFNRIGRSCEMDVQVMDDPAVTRENHCSVVYDDRQNQFSVIPSSGALTYYNGLLLTGPENLKTGDEISLGNSKFEFIPFCREGRVWEKEEES